MHQLIIKKYIKEKTVIVTQGIINPKKGLVILKQAHYTWHFFNVTEDHSHM